MNKISLISSKTYTHAFWELALSSSMIFTTSFTNSSNYDWDIFPSPLASNYFKISLISSSDGSSTLNASVSLLRIIPSSCLSINPDLSVSNVLKAVESYFLAMASVWDSSNYDI